MKAQRKIMFLSRHPECIQKTGKEGKKEENSVIKNIEVPTDSSLSLCSSQLQFNEVQ